MSYCRWSTDSFRCDLYAYECVDDTWTIHVASNRIPDDAPRALPLPRPGEDHGLWMRAQQELSQYLETCERTPINGPHDGETFKEPDLESFLARLLYLRNVGYRFPDWVLDDVREEIAGAGDETNK